MIDVDDRLFVRWDRFAHLVYGVIIVGLLITCVGLYRHSAHDTAPMDRSDEQYIATGKRFIEFLYSLNAATVVEDNHLLTRMIHPSSAALKQQHLQYLIDKDIVQKTKAAGLRSRIDWGQSTHNIVSRAKGARVIRYNAVYDYKSATMTNYAHKNIAIEVGLMQDSLSDQTPYGVWVYDWDNQKDQKDHNNGDQP